MVAVVRIIGAGVAHAEDDPSVVALLGRHHKQPVRRLAWRVLEGTT